MLVDGCVGIHDDDCSINILILYNVNAGWRCTWWSCCCWPRISSAYLGRRLIQRLQQYRFEERYVGIGRAEENSSKESDEDEEGYRRSADVGYHVMSELCESDCLVLWWCQRRGEASQIIKWRQETWTFVGNEFKIWVGALIPITTIRLPEKIHQSFYLTKKKAPPWWTTNRLYRQQQQQ